METAIDNVIQMHTKTHTKGQVLLAGGSDISKEALVNLGYRVHTHWRKLPANPEIPFAIDLVVLVSNEGDFWLTKYLREACEEEFLPLVFTKSNLLNFEESLQKAVNVVTEQEEKSVVEYLCNAQNYKEEANMEGNTEKHDGRTDGKNVMRAKEKVDFLRELLRKDAKTPTEDLQSAVLGKFGKGLTPTTIAQVRWEEFGVKIGPRGKLIFRGQEGTTTSQPAPKKTRRVALQTTAGQVSRPVERNDRLSSILTQLRAIMKETHVTSLEIPADGQVKAIQEMPREVRFNLH